MAQVFASEEKSAALQAVTLSFPSLASLLINLRCNSLGSWNIHMSFTCLAMQYFIFWLPVSQLTISSIYKVKLSAWKGEEQITNHKENIERSNPRQTSF